MSSEDKRFFGPLSPNRAARRKALKRGAFLPRQGQIERVKILPIEALMDSDDIELCERELAAYKDSWIISQRLTRAMQTGIIASFSDAFHALMIDENKEKARTLIRGRIRAGNLKERRNLSRELAGLYDSVSTLYHDEDERDFFHSFQGIDLPFGLILDESNRDKKERIDLLQLQIEWLREHPSLPEQEVANVIETQDQDGAESRKIDPTGERPFALTDWNLFWTTRMWSKNPNHLVKISTDTRKKASSDLEQVARGTISVKPESIIKAIEFHLSKDVIQKALSIRNKYGPEHIRDWIKLKRGHDRILVYIPDVEQTFAIFFAAGRDIVYRRI